MPELLTSGNSVVFFILLYSLGMKYPVAIMQGRLSSDSRGRFQFFPREWESEFSIAKEIGFYGIEWICDWQEMEEDTNPLLLEAQIELVIQKAQDAGIVITAICADWYMKYDLRDAAQAKTDWLNRAIEATLLTAERRIVIPLLEKNAPHTTEEERRIMTHLTPSVRLAQERGAVLAFETEMDVSRLTSFIDSFQSDAVGVNYDIGNCTSYGFDCPSDILALGHRVKGVHLKDRKRGTSASVMLGSGDADFAGCLASLGSIGWIGSLTMQAWRSPENYKEEAKQQLAFIQQLQHNATS